MTPEDRKRIVQNSLSTLEVVKTRTSPLCPYLTGEEVFKKSSAPHHTGENWVRETNELKNRKFIDQDRDVQEHVIGKDKSVDYSLKHKLRDHVHDLFTSLASVDSDHKKISISKTTYIYDSKMQRELGVIEKGNRKRTNAYSNWAEQRARDKQLGLSSK